MRCMKRQGYEIYWLKFVINDQVGQINAFVKCVQAKPRSEVILSE